MGYLTSVPRHVRLFRQMCNGYYYLILGMALAGTVRLWRDRSGGAWLLVPLYCEGLILAQLLVEVAGRYHYSLIPMLVLLGQVPGRKRPHNRGFTGAALPGIGRNFFGWRIYGHFLLQV